jgi:hypothetical protein
MKLNIYIVLISVLVAGCNQTPAPAPATEKKEPSAMEKKMAQYTTVPLTADTAALSEKERQMLPLLIDAAKTMDEIFWMETYGDKAKLMSSISDPDIRRYAEINYGPWDRLDDNKPFVPNVGEKPKGAAFYPSDISKEEFEKVANDQLKSLYTIVRKDPAGKLTAIPYHEAFADPTKRAADKLKQAASLAEDPGLKKYLELRADALLTDKYQPSDLAWMDMKSNNVDVVIGPIETYEDELFGYKAAHEAYVLIKDKEWSGRLAKYIGMLPGLQKALPVPAEYKKETPGTNSDLNAYDAVFYAGEANSGAKTIAINLPNDEEVQLKKGTRRLQLKNVMRAKFDKIVAPINDILITPEQRKEVTFDAFFSNVMFHEVAHGLGIKNVIKGKGTVRAALKEQAGALEEAKADVLGLFLVTQLQNKGELGNADVKDYLVSFLASIFRSVRFGGADAHGRANRMEFNFLMQNGAFIRDDATGTWRVDFDKMQTGVNALSEKILKFQGDGDYEGVKAFMTEMIKISPSLQADLDKLGSANIPIDIIFDQGK